MHPTIETICKAVGITIGLSSIGVPLYFSDDWGRRALQREIQEIQASTEGTLHYVPWRNLFQGTVVPTTKDCEENPRHHNYDCLLYLQEVVVPVHYSPKTVAMLSRFDEAAASGQKCFLSATPTVQGLELASLSCQKTAKYEE